MGNASAAGGPHGYRCRFLLCHIALSRVREHTWHTARYFATVLKLASAVALCHVLFPGDPVFEPVKVRWQDVEDKGPRTRVHFIASLVIYPLLSPYFPKAPTLSQKSQLPWLQGKILTPPDVRLAWLNRSM